jgi:hypothetical protein
MECTIQYENHTINDTLLTDATGFIGISQESINLVRDAPYAIRARQLRDRDHQQRFRG